MILSIRFLTFLISRRVQDAICMTRTIRAFPRTFEIVRGVTNSFKAIRGRHLL